MNEKCINPLCQSTYFYSRLDGTRVCRKCGCTWNYPKENDLDKLKKEKGEI